MTMTDRNRIFMVFLALLYAALAACGSKGNAPSPAVQQVTAVAVGRLAAVEINRDASGVSELVIPETSIFHRGALDGVYVVGADGKVDIRWIVTGRSSSGGIAVLGGLEAGEKVVADGSVQLEDGITVEERISETR
jgi:multidrug efflux pump subunit AcrA (membrane-fusion protein)